MCFGGVGFYPLVLGFSFGGCGQVPGKAQFPLTLTAMALGSPKGTQAATPQIGRSMQDVQSGPASTPESPVCSLCRWKRLERSCPPGKRLLPQGQKPLAQAIVLTKK